MDFQTLLYDVDADGVATITLNRPDALNALNRQLVGELGQAMRAAKSDPAVRGVVLTGSGEKAFAAGADISEFAGMEPLEAHRFALRGQAVFNAIEQMPKPVVAAVNGFALGGGCELAMMADFILASDSAKFGQPEIKLGVAPGMGGSQRLTRAVGKSKAMEMCLTGRMMNAEEAERAGLVARIIPAADLLDEAMKSAATIAAMPPLAAMVNKEMVNAAYETTLDQGLLHERRLFQILTATEDKVEGMNAFIEKRDGNWKGR